MPVDSDIDQIQNAILRIKYLGQLRSFIQLQILHWSVGQIQDYRRLGLVSLKVLPADTGHKQAQQYKQKHHHPMSVPAALFP